MIAPTPSYLITDNKQTSPLLIRHFLRNPRTTPDPSRLIILVADTRHVAETRIVADTILVAALFWLTQILLPAYVLRKPTLISNMKQFLISVTPVPPAI